jgi:hypothetical protein
MDPKQTPKIPKKIRKWARDQLKHFPSEYEIDELEKIHSLKDTDSNVLLQECMKRLDSVRGDITIAEQKINKVGNAIIETINRSKR